MNLSQTPTPEPIDQPAPVTSPTELSAQDERTQHINNLIQSSSSVLKKMADGISRIGREIAMMILRR